MQKGYLPYLGTRQADRSSGREPKLSFKFAAHEASGAFSREQVDEFHRVVKDFVESKRQLHSARESARVRDAFYSLNILPPPDIRKYLDKAGIYDSATEALRSDWEKIGLDLWSSTLGVHLNHVAGE